MILGKFPISIDPLLYAGFFYALKSPKHIKFTQSVFAYLSTQHIKKI